MNYFHNRQKTNGRKRRPRAQKFRRRLGHRYTATWDIGLTAPTGDRFLVIGLECCDR